MARGPIDGEQGEGEIRKRLEAMRRAKRDRVRWTASRHTAELAIVALQPEPPREYKRSRKHRRRKRHKRML
ncbi:MAG TPA: hypothetical protein VG818_07560 [Gemmatimonadaceae bacterium]|jgi:hypothetical protein|nr:hypothetical protein [Gemmatimonadaceae bacterium]